MTFILFKPKLLLLLNRRAWNFLGIMIYIKKVPLGHQEIQQLNKIIHTFDSRQIDMKKKWYIHSNIVKILQNLASTKMLLLGHIKI